MGVGETTPKDQRLGRMMAAVVKAAAAVAAGRLTRLPMSCLRLISTVSRTSANGRAADSATWLMTSARTVSASVAPLPSPRRPGQLSGRQPHLMPSVTVDIMEIAGLPHCGIPVGQGRHQDRVRSQLLTYGGTR